MEVQRTTQGHNVSMTTQTLQQHPVAHTQLGSLTHLQDTFQQRAQSLLMDQANVELVQEMEEELALWMIKAIVYFLLTLLFYINLEYPLPYEALILLPLLSDVLHFLYYLRKLRKIE